MFYFSSVWASREPLLVGGAPVLGTGGEIRQAQDGDIVPDGRRRRVGRAKDQAIRVGGLGKHGAILARKGADAASAIRLTERFRT